MICYRDMSFCSQDAICGNTDCYRKRTEEDYQRAEEMGLPFGLMNFLNENCGFVPVEGIER